MNERLPYCNMRKAALLARVKIGQKRLLTETDQLLRNSLALFGRISPNLIATSKPHARPGSSHEAEKPKPA
jgi:hypothetical protein